MISIGWWENFVSEKSPFKLFQLIANANNVFQNKRYFIYIFASILKALVFFAATLLIFLSKEGQVRFMFDNFYDAFTSHVIDAVSFIKNAVIFKLLFKLDCCRM